MTEKDLDKMLERYCASEPETSFEYKPSHRHGRPVASSSKNRLLAAAAAIALISAVGIGAYMLFGNRFDVSTAVEPLLPTAAEVTDSTVAYEHTAEIAATQPDTSAATAAATQTAAPSGTSAVGSQNESNTVIVYQFYEAEASANQTWCIR